MIVPTSIYWVLLALGLFLACLATVVVGEGARVLRIIATVVFGVLVVLAMVGIVG